MSVSSALKTTQKNYANQKSHATYKERKDKNGKKISVKTQVSEALSILKPFLSEKTINYLSHFKHTDGGVTKANVTTICNFTGVSTGCYSDTVNPEINSTFSEPLIIKVRQTKKDKHGINRKGSQLKILQPLWKILQLAQEKRNEQEKEDEAFWSQFLEPTDIENDIENDIECNAQTHWESKDEGTFEDHKSSSIREIPLEKYKDIPIPISSGNTYIEYGNQEKEEIDFQTVSNDLYLSNIPHRIKMYLKDRIKPLVTMNFDVIEYERFINQYEFIKLEGEYEDVEYINEQDLYFITRQLINQVDKIRSTTYGIMKKWVDKYLGYKRENILGNQSKKEPIEKKPIRKEIEPNWLKAGEVEQEQAEPQKSVEEIEAFEREKEKLFKRIRDYKQNKASQEPRNDFRTNTITQEQKTPQEPIVEPENEFIFSESDRNALLSDLFNGDELTREEKSKARDSLLTRDVNGGIRDKSKFLYGMYAHVTK